MSGSIPPLPQYAFMGGAQLKAQGQFHFTFIRYVKLTERWQLAKVKVSRTLRIGYKTNGKVR
jgi:hypothetical protein